MKKLVMIKILVLIALTCLGQTKQVDLNMIKGITPADYESLYERYILNDTTLSLGDYQIIYYGQAFQKIYNPGARHDSVRALNMYLNSARDTVDFKKVLNFTQLILKDFPFNIDEIYLNAIAYNKIGQSDLSKKWFYKYDKLVKTILSSGDGKSEKTPFIVTKVSDEYSIIDALDLRPTGQALIRKKKKFYDLMNVGQNNLGIDHLIFDINLFFGKE
jgi:hypothetical protein